MTSMRWPLALTLAATMSTHCGRERRSPDPEAGADQGEGEADVGGEQSAEGEGEGEAQGGEAAGEGAAGEGGEGEGEGGEGEGEGEAGEGEGDEAPGEGEGEGEGEGLPEFCRQNADCLDEAYCDRGSGECIVVDNCEPCDPQDLCFPEDGQLRRCDNRFAAAGCCVPSCNADTDCGDGDYCDVQGPTCAPGCRIGSCGPGLICGLQDRQCREGCTAQAECPELGRMCDEVAQVCTDGCVTAEGCPEGQRCDLDALECTEGCVAHEDCGEGRRCARSDHRCVKACERDGDCLEGQRCDLDVGGCVADEGGCLAAGCPDGAAEEDVCDPVRGGCAPPAEDACEAGAACDDADRVCAPEGAAERFACVPAGGEGLAGAPCDRAADCRTGLCLGDGACYGTCAVHEDCPEGQRCWAARFLVSLSEDLLDPSGDGVREAAACRIPPTPCAHPDECEAEDEECLPWWDPDAASMATACRPAAGGAGAPGDRCHVDDDCAPGACTDDGICLHVCDGDERCGDLQLCLEVDVEADGRQGVIPACGLDPGSGQACARDTDCPEGEACHPEPGEAEDALALRCRPGLGLGPAALCDDPWDCMSAHCVRSTYCFAACTGDEDCPEGVPCQDQPSWVPGREQVVARMCVEPNLPCGRDADCPLAGQACSPEEDPEAPEELAPLCQEAVGDGQGGEDCNRDRDCASGYCVQDLPETVCWEGCVGDEDCGDDMRCYDDVAPVPVDNGDAFDTAPACLPDRGSLDGCDHNDDCEGEEVCSVVPSGDRRSLPGRCVTPSSDPANDAEFCEDPQSCSTGLCAPQNNPLFPGPCLILCAQDEDCPQGWFFGLGATCVRIDVEFMGVEDRIHYCAPPI